MMVRTVLDAREGVSKKYIWQVCLLAASWRRYMSGKSTLEILIIGRLPKAVAEFLESLGAGLIPTGPHINDKFSRSSNKLLGLSVNIKSGPILLVDNDTCFVGDAAKLVIPAGTEIMAAVAGYARISDAQWEYVGKQLGLKPLDFPWVALNDEFNAFKTGILPQPRDALYLNGGVVWIRNPEEFGNLWSLHTRQIAELFESHPLKDAHVLEDQPGFATAVGTRGGFSMLPAEYNYRPGCFGMGIRSPDNIKIIHMTNMNMPGIERAGNVEQLIRLFWEKRVMKKIGDAPPDRIESLTRDATVILEMICSIISEFNLNKIALRPNTRAGFRSLEKS